MRGKRNTFSPSRFQSILAAATAAGLPVLRSEIDKDGNIILIHHEDPKAPDAPNTFDRLTG